VTAWRPGLDSEDLAEIIEQREGRTETPCLQSPCTVSSTVSGLG